LKLETYTNAAEFLRHTRQELERQEAANNLMLGIALSLSRATETPRTLPYMAAVVDAHGPALVALMTPPHNVILHGVRPDLGAAPGLLLRDLREGGWSVPGAIGPAGAVEAFCQAWVDAAGGSYEVHMRMRVYELRRVIPPPHPGGEMRLATVDDLDLVAAWNHDFSHAISEPVDAEAARESAARKLAAGDLCLWVDGEPVSMAARARPMPHGIAVNLVYTPPEHRRRGYAAACVAALSQSLLDAGYQFCALFADLANPTSNGIYQRIGYEPVCDVISCIFKG
jgi:predicted GNAT family acetyltransferase